MHGSVRRSSRGWTKAHLSNQQGLHHVLADPFEAASFPGWGTGSGGLELEEAAAGTHNPILEAGEQVASSSLSWRPTRQEQLGVLLFLPPALATKDATNFSVSTGEVDLHPLIAEAAIEVTQEIVLIRSAKSSRSAWTNLQAGYPISQILLVRI